MDLNNSLFPNQKQVKEMKSWEHCAKTWCSISPDLAAKNINNGSYVKCEFKKRTYTFNIPDEKNRKSISTDMLKEGKWSVYTWAL